MPNLRNADRRSVDPRRESRKQADDALDTILLAAAIILVTVLFTLT
jgi:hypothetical protein